MCESKKNFFNNPETCVDESLSGFVHLYPGLQLFKTCRFVTLANNQVTENVGVISGGGSGHEPFCTGYIGHGMLCGAIAGSVFASPPKSHILQAVKHLNQFYKGGILVIIPNYTGDCLNFGMAIEHANNENIKVESFVVGEDYASGQNTIAGKRGMCGLLYIYKVAGALASEGRSLDEIIKVLHLIHENMSTLGISSKSCSLPGQPPLFHVADDQMELGTGVHGEAGIEKVKFGPAKPAVSLILSKLCAWLNVIDFKSKVVVLINNLGTTTELEQNIICNEVFNQLSEKGILVKRMYSGMLMTSLDMAGFQLSILKIADDNEKEWLRLLDKMTDAPRWVGSKMSIFENNTENTFFGNTSCEIIKSKFKLSENEKKIFKKCLTAVSQNIIVNEIKLNELDSGCGDGDCGTTLKHLAEGIQQLLVSNLECPAHVLQQLSDIAENKMGGTSGAIYSLCFSSMGKYFVDAAENSLPIVWAEALQSGLKTIKKYSRAKMGDRTLIDALEPAVSEFYEFIVKSQAKEVKSGIIKAKHAAEKGCQETKFMEAKAGRASYVNKDRLTDVDAGAYGIVVCLEAISNSF